MPSGCQLCVLALLITAGTALNCMECRDLQGKYCRGPAVTCAAEYDVCLSTLVQYEIGPSSPESQSILQALGPSPPLVFVRGCGYSQECTDVTVMRTPYNTMVTSNKCCNSDLCSPETPTAIAQASVNGLICPGCFQLSSDGCTSFTHVHCAGSETHCFSYSHLQLDENMTIAMAGCATKTACNTDRQQKSLTECTAGVTSGSHSTYSSLLLIAAGLFIIYI